MLNFFAWVYSALSSDMPLLLQEPLSALAAPSVSMNLTVLQGSSPLSTVVNNLQTRAQHIRNPCVKREKDGINH